MASKFVKGEFLDVVFLELIVDFNVVGIILTKDFAKLRNQ